MNKRIVLALALLVIGGATKAQSKLHFTPSSTEGATQCIKISTKSLIRQSPTISYEHTLTPGKGSVEGTAGWFTSGEDNRLHGFLLKAGYKWTFPINEKQRALSEKGYMCTGFYLKPELSYVYRARTYEAFTGNDGWDMYYDLVKYQDHNAAAMLQMGFQATWKNFYLELSTGLGRYVSTNAFHQGWSYAYTAWFGQNKGWCSYNTIKFGFPF